MSLISREEIRSEMESVETKSHLEYTQRRVDAGIRLLDRLREEDGISESFIEDICRLIGEMEGYQTKIDTIKDARAFSGIKYARHYKEKLETVYEFVFDIIDVCKENDLRDPIEMH